MTRRPPAPRHLGGGGDCGLSENSGPSAWPRGCLVQRLELGHELRLRGEHAGHARGLLRRVAQFVDRALAPRRSAPCRSRRSTSSERSESSGVRSSSRSATTWMTLCSDCSFPKTRSSRAPSTIGAKALEDFWPDDDVGDAGLVLERGEDHARRGARALADEHEAGDGDASSARHFGKPARLDDAARRKARAGGTRRDAPSSESESER